MKSSYELAMERLSKSAPQTTLTDAQKAKLAELDSNYAAKIAEREIFLNAELAKAVATGDHEALDQLNRQLASDRKSLRAELEEKKEALRAKGDS